MVFLNDTQLKQALNDNPQLITGFPGAWNDLPLENKRWDAADSPIQPSSIDIHVGEIFVPGSKTGDKGSVGYGLASHALESGHSVVVRSLETISLPNDIGAIALPPSRVSSKGIFVANFGHVDPGYSGQMRFTIINMGKDAFHLNRSDEIMTLLFFKISAVGTPWHDRYDKRDIDQSEIDILAKDFADLDSRVKKIVNAELGNSGYDFLWKKWIFPALTGLGAYYVSIYLMFNDKVEKLIISENKAEIATDYIEKRLEILESLQENIEKAAARDREEWLKQAQAVIENRKEQISATDSKIKRGKQANTSKKPKKE